MIYFKARAFQMGLEPIFFLHMPFGDFLDLINASDILNGYKEEGPELNKYGGEYF